MTREYKVIVFTSISVDGGISVKGKKLVLSSRNDLYRLHYLRSVSDAIVVGANTVLVDDPLLTVRINGYHGKQPYRIVIDKELRTKPYFKVYDTSIAPSILVTSSNNKDNPCIRDFQAKGVKIVFTNTLPDQTLDLREAFNKINTEYGVKLFLVEGGGYLIGSLVKQKLVDLLIVSITPYLIGLNRVNYINTELDRIVRLKLRSVYVDKDLNEVILEYRPIYE